MKSCRRCIISGKVQGVYFRQGTLEKANELGLTGWVRNLASGAVECLLCGEFDKVEFMCDWLRQGPPGAKVDDIQIEELPWQDYTTFMIRR